MHAAQLPLSLAAHLTEPLDWQLDSPPGVHVAPTQPVSAPPSGRLLDELLDSPSPVVASSLPHGADHCEQVGAHRGKSTVSKKLCLDDGAAARLPPELPLELVCLILSFLFVDDIGNHNSAIGAVSRAWRGATELLAVAWNQDPHAIPMLAAPFVVMWTFGRKMRTVPWKGRGVAHSHATRSSRGVRLASCSIRSAGCSMTPLSCSFAMSSTSRPCAPQSVKPSRSSSVANWTNGGAPEVFS